MAETTSVQKHYPSGDAKNDSEVPHDSKNYSESTDNKKPKTKKGPLTRLRAVFLSAVTSRSNNPEPSSSATESPPPYRSPEAMKIVAYLEVLTQIADLEAERKKLNRERALENSPEAKWARDDLEYRMSRAFRSSGRYRESWCELNEQREEADHVTWARSLRCRRIKLDVQKLEVLGKERQSEWQDGRTDMTEWDNLSLEQKIERLSAELGEVEVGADHDKA